MDFNIIWHSCLFGTLFRLVESQGHTGGSDNTRKVVVVVVVALLFYVHDKHLRSYRDGQLT